MSITDTISPSGAYETLSSEHYISQEIYAAESELIFAQSWHLVGHQTQTRHPGDYRTVQIAGENILIVRGDDGELRAFYNICIHRGHELVEGQGCTKLFTCPYHAWSYDTCGRLKSVPNASEFKFQRAGKSLKEVRLEILNGLVFVNLNLETQSLSETLGPTSAEIHDYLPHLPNGVHAHRETKLLNANWKIVVENFNECYHCPTVHKHLAENLLDLRDFRIVNRDTSFLHCPFSQSDGLEGLVSNPTSEQANTTFAAWLIWPLCAIQHYPGGVAMTFRWVPVSVNETRAEIDWWLTSEQPTEYEHKLIQDHANATFPEDFPLVESVQRSMYSRGFDKGVLLVDERRTALSEHAVKGFQDMYRRAMKGSSV